MLNSTKILLTIVAMKVPMMSWLIWSLWQHDKVAGVIALFLALVYSAMFIHWWLSTPVVGDQDDGESEK